MGASSLPWHSSSLSHTSGSDPSVGGASPCQPSLLAQASVKDAVHGASGFPQRGFRYPSPVFFKEYLPFLEVCILARSAVCVHKVQHVSSPSSHLSEAPLLPCRPGLVGPLKNSETTALHLSEVGRVDLFHCDCHNCQPAVQLHPSGDLGSLFPNRRGSKC